MKTYLDDIIIYAPFYNLLLQRLDKLFRHMTKAGIKLNLSKCSIGQKEVKFLGHIVSSEGYRPDPSNIEAVQKMKPPSNVREVRRFLGMIGFYRKHIDQFSKIVIPLTDLTKNSPFIWSADCQQAFENLNPFSVTIKFVSRTLCVLIIFYFQSEKLKILSNPINFSIFF